MGLVALFMGISALVRHLVGAAPEWINVPAKAAYLRLPEASRRRAIAPALALLEGLPAVICLTFAWIQWGGYRVAIGRWSSLPPWPLFACLAAVFAWAAWGIWATRRAVHAEVRASKG